MYPRAVAKISSCQYMQLVGGEWTIFDLLNSYLALRLGGIKQKKFVLFIAEPQDDFFCFIPSSPEAKYEFYYIRIILLFYCPARKFFWFQFLFVPYESSWWKSPALSDSPVHPLPTPRPPLKRPHFNIIKMMNKTELTLLLLTHPTNHFP